jgi:hypothetical protein
VLKNDVSKLALPVAGDARSYLFKLRQIWKNARLRLVIRLLNLIRRRILLDGDQIHEVLDS